MKTGRPLGLLILIAALALVAAACGSTDDTTTTTAAPTGGADTTTTTAPPAEETTTTAEEAMEELIFGMILVGPENDRGWSQAHREGGFGHDTALARARKVGKAVAVAVEAALAG